MFYLGYLPLAHVLCSQWSSQPEMGNGSRNLLALLIISKGQMKTGEHKRVPDLTDISDMLCRKAHLVPNVTLYIKVRFVDTQS